MSIVPDPGVDEAAVRGFTETGRRLEETIGQVVVGQHAVVREVLIAVLAGGHVLLEGVPGLGKTLLVRTLGQALSLRFARIQFTPDLMPADITGTNIITEDEAGRRLFSFQAGPLFANVVLADEVNRATPKTQSALLEAMQERTVTVGGETRALLEGRYNASVEDVQALAHAVLRHRVLLNFEGQAEGLTTNALVDRLLDTVSA